LVDSHGYSSRQIESKETLVATDPMIERIEPMAVDFKTGSKLTSLSPHTLRAYVRKGKIRGTRCGRRWLIPIEELRRLVREGCC
jgi:excisionase family DNA binding protein